MRNTQRIRNEYEIPEKSFEEHAKELEIHYTDPHMDYEFMGLVTELMYENRSKGDWRIKPISGRYSLGELADHFEDHARDFLDVAYLSLSDPNSGLTDEQINKIEQAIDNHLVHAIANAMMFIGNFRRYREMKNVKNNTERIENIA